MTEQQLEQRLRTWYRAEIGEAERAPAALRASVAAIPQAGSTYLRRTAWRFPTMNIATRLAVAAVIGIIAVGGASYLIRPTQPSIGTPTQSPGLSSNPTESANPTDGPISSVVPARPATWTATGSMHFGGFGTATLLPNGKVLVASATSYGTNQDTAAELYDPAAGSWSLSGSMTTGRSSFSATLLQDGRVLVAGGVWDAPPGNAGELASAEVYDPATGTWARTGSMIKARLSQTATLLPDGKVLVAGGAGNDGLGGGCCGPLASAELYDPGTGTWTATGNMTTQRVDDTATLLHDGKVLVTGGNGTSAELYDPATGTWARTGSRVTSAVVNFTATLLPDGRVLLAGGWTLHVDAQQNAIPLASAEIYEPVSGTWTATASMPTPRMQHMATLLPDGRVLVTGGDVGGSTTDNPMILAGAFLFDPGTGQ